MSHEEVVAWLHGALGELPRVAAQPQPHGGVTYRRDDVELGQLHPCGLAGLDMEPDIAELVVRNGWAKPDSHGGPGRLTVDLSRSAGGAVALWLLLRNYRQAGELLPAPVPDGSAERVSFDTPGLPPSIPVLDGAGSPSVPSSS